jgi:hypothetical protein
VELTKRFIRKNVQLCGVASHDNSTMGFLIAMDRWNGQCGLREDQAENSLYLRVRTVYNL